MARNKIDECLFCGSVPCVCNKAKATPAKPPKPPRQMKVPPPPVAAVKIPTRAAPSSVQAPKISIRNIRSQEETDMRTALTAIADAELLAAEELIKHRDMIDLPAWRIDALIWRQG